MRFLLLTSQSEPNPVLKVLLTGLILPSVIVVGLELTGYDAVAAVRDGSLSEVPEAGLISNMGIALMAIACSTAVVFAWRSSNPPLGILGLFCCLFVIDDALLIHERLGRWEVLFYAGYGLLALVIILLFWRLTERLAWPMMIASGSFVASVVVDLLWGALVDFTQPTAEARNFLLGAGFIIEDVPKFGGIFVLSCFAIGESMSVRSIRKRG